MDHPVIRESLCCRVDSPGDSRRPDIQLYVKTGAELHGEGKFFGPQHSKGRPGGLPEGSDTFRPAAKSV